MNEARFQYLLASLHDEDPHVRFAAARNLGYGGDRRAVEPLLLLLDDQGLLPWGTVSVGAIQALGRLGDERTVERLIRVLQHSQLLEQIEAARAWSLMAASSAAASTVAVAVRVRCVTVRAGGPR